MKNIPRYWGYAETKVGILVWRSSPNNQTEADAEARKAAWQHDEATKALSREELKLA